MRRPHPMLLAGLAGIVLLVGVPGVMARLDFFRVRQVEIVGVRYHSPEQIVRGAELGADRNVFESLRDVRRRVERIPGVASVRVARQLPGTLRFAVTERVPVAFASGPKGLVALDERARPLPYDPTIGSVDVPVIERPDSIVTQALSVVRRVDPALYAEIDQARRYGGGVIVSVGERTIVFAQAPAAKDIESVAAVRRHLVSTGEAYDQLDARYADLVVVRREA